MVMPLTPLEIALQKVLAHVVVVLAAFTLSLCLVVQQLFWPLQRPLHFGVPAWTRYGSNCP